MALLTRAASATSLTEVPSSPFCAKTRRAAARMAARVLLSGLRDFGRLPSECFCFFCRRFMSVLLRSRNAGPSALKSRRLRPGFRKDHSGTEGYQLTNRLINLWNNDTLAAGCCQAFFDCCSCGASDLRRGDCLGKYDRKGRFATGERNRGGQEHTFRHSSKSEEIMRHAAGSGSVRRAFSGCQD